MNILRNAAEQQLLKPFRTHGWNAIVSAEDAEGEYLTITGTKAGATRKVALLYTSATSNTHYKALDSLVDYIFTNGALYQIEAYTRGVTTPVVPIDEFFPLLVTWNKELAPPGSHRPLPPSRPRLVRIITSENPLSGIWSQLDQFASMNLAQRLITRRAEEASVSLSPGAIRAKALGVAFSIRSASDYFRGVPFESLNKRILSLYYGTIALAFAEMLASQAGPSDLDEVEGTTKQGHGLYTVPSAVGDFGGLSVGVLATGFFPHWASFLGHDTSHFPRAKAKTSSDLEKQPSGTVTTMCALLAALPELGDLFLEVFQTPPSWIVPIFNLEENSGSRAVGHAAKTESTYIHLIDSSARIAHDRICASGWPITEVTPLAATGAEHRFRARVDHAGHKFWYEALPLHHSPFRASPTLILPVITGISEYRTVATATLYALSIMVRYMPSSWRRVEGGDWDEHLALIKNALGVFERLLPEEFLESIIGERISANQPGRF
jgi:hypothetical protein